MNPTPVLLALLAMVCPALAQEPGERPLITGRTEIIVHRGGSGPDGTIAGVSRSLNAGVGLIELDVRLTRDGHAVILHDPSVDRTTDGIGLVQGFTLEQVKKLDAGAKYRDPAEPEKSYAGERIPTVEEMIRFVGNRGVLLLELKVPEAAEPVVAAVRDQHAFGRVIVRAEKRELLQRLKTLDARVRTGTMRKRTPENAGPLAEELAALGVASVTVPAADREQVAIFHGKGIAVWGSNTNDSAVMSALIDAGVDGIITDQRLLLADLLQGQQPPPAPSVEEGPKSPVQAALRGGLWRIPDFQATLPSGSRAFTREALFDLGLDVSVDLGPLFLTASADYGLSSQVSLVSGALQAGVQDDIGELLVPLSLRGSAGLLVGKLDVDQSRFGDFKTGVGFVVRVEVTGRLTETLTASLWLDYRQIEFDFEPTVTSGDDTAGGATFAFGVSVGLRF